MTLNPKQHLVIVKGEDKTVDVLKIEKESKRSIVTYNNGKSYPYNAQNVELLSNPKCIPIQDCRLSISGDMLSDVECALRFNNWVKIFHKNGVSRCCLFSELSIQQMKMPDGRSNDILAYFRELADGASLKTVEDDSLLAIKYRHLNRVPKTSILSDFIKNHTSSTPSTSTRPVSQLLFPFGCNMSQKLAIHAALQNPISLIQGPPGTGKTQTILNLIANLLLQGKRVAVVSNNNSATANVNEKMKKYSLDFLTAFLGKAENKAMFIESQENISITMPSLNERDETSVRKEVFRLNNELDRAFESKNRLAVVIHQLDAIRLEWNHYERYLRETIDSNSKVWDRGIETKVPSQELLKHWLIYEREAKARFNKEESDLLVNRSLKNSV